jgi:Acetyltransferases, including N-acetylases of ribosomal proteins
MLEPDFNPFPEIQTNRLLLRRMTDQDAAEILKLRSDENVMRYIDRKRAENIEDARQWLQIVENALDNNTGITWGITMKDNPGVIIGSIGYWRIIKEHYRAEVGYMLSQSFWRQGIMKEALTNLIDFGFRELKLHSIEAHINTLNLASANILLATGFVQEAYFKENFFWEGTFRDTIVFSQVAGSR